MSKKRSIFCIIIIIIFFFFFFFFYIYKINLISAEGYKNAGVQCLKIRKTDELWVGMKDVGVGLGVKSISDLVLKEMKEETKCYKMTEREIS